MLWTDGGLKTSNQTVQSAPPSITWLSSLQLHKSYPSNAGLVVFVVQLQLPFVSLQPGKQRCLVTVH
jgi:hypothetical protein